MGGGRGKQDSLQSSQIWTGSCGRSNFCSLAKWAGLAAKEGTRITACSDGTVMRPFSAALNSLTYSMVQSPWEANWFAASQEIPRISRNSKVHYRTHKRPPPVSILGNPNPVHIPTSWRSILILSTHRRLGLISGLFPSGFPTTLYTPSPHPYAPHA